ncbi:MAG: hypothetical protein M0Z53_01380 [Thermaerobacter sp.]|nr:hypothetical protein [Thermaerobacter sp.]
MSTMPGRVDAERDRLLTGLLPSPWLRETAATVGLVRRQRQIDPVTFLGVLVLGFGTGVQRSLASLRRA